MMKWLGNREYGMYSIVVKKEMYNEWLISQLFAYAYILYNQNDSRFVLNERTHKSWMIWQYHLHRVLHSVIVEKIRFGDFFFAHMYYECGVRALCAGRCLFSFRCNLFSYQRIYPNFECERDRADFFGWIRIVTKSNGIHQQARGTSTSIFTDYDDG